MKGPPAAGSVLRVHGLIRYTQDPETYIHRSGRTGRAGSTGVSVTLVDRKKEGLIPFIQRRAGVAFERIGAPQPAEMARIAGVCVCVRVHILIGRVSTLPLRSQTGWCTSVRVEAACVRWLAHAKGSRRQGRPMLCSVRVFTRLAYGSTMGVEVKFLCGQAACLEVARCLETKPALAL